MSNSVLGEDREVRRFLAISADAEIMVMDKDDYRNTLLSMVAAERYSRIIILFLDRRAQINSRNNIERTSLMEAALWGRFENTRDSLSKRNR